MYRLLFLSFVLFLFSCEVEGVKKQSLNDDNLELENELESRTDKEEMDNSSLQQLKDDFLALDNGITITWKKKGEGSKIKQNDMVLIDYVSALEDGKIYDGNHLIKKKAIPFFVGWNLQTPGWDIALKELRVGDDVEIFIPSELDRGEKGIPGVVPPNSNSIVSLKVLEMLEPNENVDGIKIWRVEEKKNITERIDFEDEVMIHYWASSASKARYDNSYKRGEPFRLVMGDGNIVPGLYKALHFAKEGDKLMIYIPAEQAYGEKGFQDLVKPNEDLFYDVLVYEVNKN